MYKEAEKAFLESVRSNFGNAFANQVQKTIEEKKGKERPEMGKSKALYAVYVVDQEKDTVEQPDYVIATGEGNAKYKVLHAKDVEDPDDVDVFVQYIGTLKDDD